MATIPWSIPTGKEITGATYIKDTDDKIAATIEDLVDWCNNANGAYNDYTLTGLRTNFVDLDTAQTITSVKTINTLGAVDFTGGELRIGGTAVTSTAAELNILDGVTSTTAELNILDGVTATTADLNKTSNITSGTYTPTVSDSTIASETMYQAMYQRVGNIVTVTGSFLYQFSSAGLGTISITLPIASDLTSNDTSANGVVTRASTTNSAFINASAATDTAVIWISESSTSLQKAFYTFSYIVA